MINRLISGVCKKISEFFNECEIYKDDIKQGLTEPCFLISALKPEHRQFMGSRYERTVTLMIQYFPESKTAPNVECNAVLEKLFWVLEEVETEDGSFRSFNMSGETVDDVLQLSVDFIFYILKIEEKPRMESISNTTEVER